MTEISGSTNEQFLAAVSHELRGPLHAILGLSELLVNSNLSSGDSRLVKALHEEARAMAVLVDDVVEYGHFNSTTPTLSDDPFAPRSLVSSVVDRLRDSAEKSGLQLLIEFDSEVPLRILGDSVRFGQVVHNLVSNAIRYTESGSIRVVLAADDQTISLQVRDSGVGMSPSELETIFDPFVRVGSRAVTGTGLGLAIVKRIAEVMEGSITVESTPGVGTSFLFTVPCRVAIDKTIEETSARALPHGTVLVVEDNEVNQTLAIKQLELIGLGAEVVESGEAAIEFLQVRTVDLVLMDWNLAEMNGLETAEQIRREGLIEEHVPIIAMTANVLAGDRAACLEAGMNDHLAKPVSLADMRYMMGRWLSLSPDAQGHSNGDRSIDESGSHATIREAVSDLVEDLGSADTVRVVVETYLSELASRSRFLTEPNPDESDEARRAAHTLRSTSALIGAEHLATLCVEFEQASPPTEILRSKLETEIQSVKEELTELLRMGIAA